MLNFLRLFILTTLTTSTVGLAFPVLIEGNQVNGLLSTPRSHLIAVIPPGPEQKNWRRVPHQIDEIEDEALIVFREPGKVLPLRNELPRPGKKDPFKGKLKEFHRITVDDKDFLSCNSACESQSYTNVVKLCESSDGATPKFVKVTLSHKRTSLFIVACNTPQPEMKQFIATANLEKFTFANDIFKYRYKNNRDILFDGISAGNHVDLIGPSELKVYLKPKYFLNLEFDNTDLVSRVTSLTEGPQSLGVETAFALTVLNMKVNTQICCDMSIYRDAFYFPVVLDLPFEGKSFKKGSGLFYGFGFQGNWKEDIKVFASGLTGEQANSDSNSSALLVKDSEGNRIAVGFRSITDENGIKLVPSLATKKDLQKMEFPKIKGDFGLFYDVTTLTKGFHAFQIWFYVGKENEEEVLLEYAKNGVRYTAKEM